MRQPVRLHLGDCLKVLPRLRPGGIDVAVLDPPYGVGLGVPTRSQKWVKCRSPKSRQLQPYEGYEDTPENLERLIEGLFPLLRRLTARIVVTPGVKNLRRWPEPDHVGSFYYPAGTGFSRWGFCCWQPIFYYGKDPWTSSKASQSRGFGHSNGKGFGSRPDSFLSIERAKPNGHPCPKPLGQWTWLVERVSLPGETVLDPLMGSGTTGVACVQTGRRFVGVELVETYFRIAKARIGEARREKETTLCR